MIQEHQAFPRLAGLAEIAGLAGVSRQRASQITAHPDFPEPVQRLAMGPVWLEADVKAFLATPRKPGRKPAAGALSGPAAPVAAHG
jgi:prophage regulatory protein